MEFFRDLKTLTLPWTTKAFIVGLLLLTVAVNVGLFAFSLIQSRNDLMSATVQLFGVLLPLIVVVTVLARAGTGVAALRRRTEALFLHVLPEALAGVCEHSGAFYAPNPRRRPPAMKAEARVLTNAVRGECYADLAVFAPVAPGAWKAVVLRLEINVSRVNLNICVPAALLHGEGAGDAVHGARLLFSAFRHSLAGARSQAPAHGEEAPQTGYAFLDEPIVRTVEGIEFVCLVGSKYVPKEFLWDSAEQLQFAQDLMFMVRALLAEAPHYFVTVTSDAPPDSFAAIAAALPAPGARHPLHVHA